MSRFLPRYFSQWRRTSRDGDHFRVPLGPVGLLANTVGGALLLHVVVSYAYTVKYVGGISMYPTFTGRGEGILVNKQYRRGRGIEVGDAVTFNHPMKDEGALKRVVGMPGDFVLVGAPHKGNGTMMQVPAGHCFLAGDNLAWSRDSRMFGAVPLAMIKGKVVAKVWPLREMRWIENTLKPYEYVEEEAG